MMSVIQPYYIRLDEGVSHVSSTGVKPNTNQGKLKAWVVPDRNTLLVYWYLYSHPQNTSGPRTLQRALGFSSPSIAVFHLDKLVGTGLVQKQSDGRYRIAIHRKFGAMNQFYHIRKQWVPKHLLYATLTTTAAIPVLVLLFMSMSPLASVALVPMALSAAIQWYEGLLLWRIRPRFSRTEEA